MNVVVRDGPESEHRSLTGYYKQQFTMLDNLACRQGTTSVMCINNQLFKCNDETIRAVSHSDIDRDCVYMAVYML